MSREAVTAAACAQALSTAAQHCSNAEVAADEKRWDAVQAEVRAMQQLLEELFRNAGPTELAATAPQPLTAIGAQVERLRTRLAAGRDEIATELTSRRRRRSAAASYRRHR